MYRNFFASPRGTAEAWLRQAKPLIPVILSEREEAKRLKASRRTPTMFPPPCRIRKFSREHSMPLWHSFGADEQFLRAPLRYARACGARKNLSGRFLRHDSQPSMIQVQVLHSPGFPTDAGFFCWDEASSSTNCSGKQNDAHASSGTVCLTGPSLLSRGTLGVIESSLYGEGRKRADVKSGHAPTF
jgi:hypothetical protein